MMTAPIMRFVKDLIEYVDQHVTKKVVLTRRFAKLAIIELNVFAVRVPLEIHLLSALIQKKHQPPGLNVMRMVSALRWRHASIADVKIPAYSITFAILTKSAEF